MISFADSSPVIHVEFQEYLRLLGYPRGHVLTGRAVELCDWARDWYAANGRPWVFARQVNRSELAEFTSQRLHATLDQAGAHSAILLAASAGPEAEEHAADLWHQEKPDEYFFLEVYASAVVEHLVASAGARLCAAADPQGMTVLPHYSPGYAGWDIAEQAALFRLIGDSTLPGPFEVLESGGLRPKKSLLAVFGLTAEQGLPQAIQVVPCENCSFGPCAFRRAPYRHQRIEPQYAVNIKALKRWAAERLKFEPAGDGALDARFLYEGTTCTNLGRPLTFEYRVRLGPREAHYPILEQSCAPSPADTGHRHMCQYQTNPEHLMAAIRDEKPLAGRPLEDVLAWRRPFNGAGCYCDPDSRRHKWGLVLETIHYALSRRDHPTP